jgi:hypothetical protein
LAQMQVELAGKLHYKLNQIQNSKNPLQKAKHCRGFFLLLNKNKHLSFSFDDYQFWKNMYQRHIYLVNQIQNRIDDYDKKLNTIKHNIITNKELVKISQSLNREYALIENERRYYKIVLKTVCKYPIKYGSFIGLVLNRTFCRNVALYIRAYI